MPIEFDLAELTETTLCKFSAEFVENPYLCYTEHGLHALFFARLYEALPKNLRYFDFNGQKVCTLQKEYPTHHDLGKSRRQNWDISVIQNPIVMPDCKYPYDHLPLAAVVEFGLNCGTSHILDDIERLSHASSNVGLRLAAHFYRFSIASGRFCGRDWSPKAKSLCSKEEIKGMLLNREPVIVYYGIADGSAPISSGVWRLSAEASEQPRPLAETSEINQLSGEPNDQIRATN